MHIYRHVGKTDQLQWCVNITGCAGICFEFTKATEESKVHINNLLLTEGYN